MSISSAEFLLPAGRLITLQFLYDLHLELTRLNLKGPTEFDCKP